MQPNRLGRLQWWNESFVGHMRSLKGEGAVPILLKLLAALCCVGLPFSACDDLRRLLAPLRDVRLIVFMAFLIVILILFLYWNTIVAGYLRRFHRR